MTRVKFETPEQRAKRLERMRAAKAVDDMAAARPLRPPPGRPAVRCATAGELALLRDQRLGLVGDGSRFLDAPDGGDE